jgi:ATP:ADP antiporter, AAA family
MMGLFFLVVCAVGILRPIKNALALGGLGSDFAKVYLVSGVVLLFVPIFTRLADRFAWRAVFSGVALFFAANLVLFRIFYREGSGAFGIAFYGWYDLFAAALVAQFFMATQVYFDARSAKRAYPIVIAGGSIGATLGGAITGFFAQSVGTPNLLLVAAALITLFALGIPWVLKNADGQPSRRPGGKSAVSALRGASDLDTLAQLARDRQVRLIASTVLLTIVVKQLIDFQFNTISWSAFGSVDAVSAFQGKFNAATQWLPLIVLAGLRPALKRWGIGVAVLLLPVLMLGATVALAVTLGLWAAVLAKGADTSLRYSAERAGREMLYVPVRDEIKMKAKAWIDVGLEKGLGKFLSAFVIMGLGAVLSPRGIAWVSAFLAVLWFAAALAVRHEYVRTLARSIEGRFASLRGVFTSLGDATTLPVVRAALVHPSPLRSAFALELLTQQPAGELRVLAPELSELVRHERPEIRAAALEQLSRIADVADEQLLRESLHDAVPAVREAAVRALLAASGDGAPQVLNGLLNSGSGDVRTAALAALAVADASPALRAAGRSYVSERWNGAAPSDASLRAELALAAGAFEQRDDEPRFLDAFLEDDDPRVLGTALRSAALLGRTDCCDRMIRALASPQTRPAARDALATLGAPALPALTAVLLNESAPPAIRRAVPSTLARIPDQQTVDAMLRLVLAPETDQLLDYRTIKALSKLRAGNPSLRFDRSLVQAVAERESDTAAHYADVMAGLPASGDRLVELLRTALREAVSERREGVMRCIGMLHPPEPVRHAARGLEHPSAAHRARALEWIEETVGSDMFRRLTPVLEGSRRAARPQPVTTLLHDGDSWVAHLARAVTSPDDHDMDLIEKVFLLQQVDLLRGARGAHVALLASIAEEVEVTADSILFDEGDVPGSMYVVTRGSVELRGVGQRLVVGAEHAFGTWSLIDDQPSPIQARACEPTRLLRVTREDFHDLLADHSELALGLLKGLAHRMRSLVA